MFGEWNALCAFYNVRAPLSLESSVKCLAFCMIMPPLPHCHHRLRSCHHAAAGAAVAAVAVVIMILLWLCQSVLFRFGHLFILITKATNTETLQKAYTEIDCLLYKRNNQNSGVIVCISTTHRRIEWVKESPINVGFVTWTCFIYEYHHKTLKSERIIISISVRSLFLSVAMQHKTKRAFDNTFYYSMVCCFLFRLSLSFASCY